MIDAGSRGLRLRNVESFRRGIWTRAVALPLLLLAALLGSSVDASAADASEVAAEPRRFVFSRAAQQDREGFYFQPAGLCEDYPEETTTSAKIAAEFDVLRQTGTKLLRFGIGWDGVESAPGEYDWRRVDEIVEAAGRDGVTLLPYVCYTPEWAGAGDDHWREPPRNLEHFGSFMFAIASRYRRK